MSVLVQITHRESLSRISELTGAALTIKGKYCENGQSVPDGERKLYLIIEGPTELVVKRAQVWLWQSLPLLATGSSVACLSQWI